MLHALVVRGLTTDARIIPEKCGTGVLGHAHALTNSPKDTWSVRIQAAPPASDVYFLSPSGRFKIHYIRQGTGATAEAYVQAVARFADEAYQFEIEQLGYVKPPYTAADSTYHLYLSNIGASGNYGYTDEVIGGELATTPSGLRRVRTFMVIENDFLDSVDREIDGVIRRVPVFPTQGLDAARITVFHEFHHMVQFGSYGRDFTDGYLQEMTSTWFEMLSDADVNDYIQYIPDYIGSLTLSFDKSPRLGRYGQAIWLEFLASRFDRNTIRSVWEHYRDISAEPLEAFGAVLKNAGSSFSCEYAKFGEELFFTGNKTRVRTPFSDASRFPREYLEVHRVAPGEPYAANPAFVASLHLVSTGFGADSVVLSIARDTARLASANIVTAIIDGPSSYSTVYSDPARFCESFGEPERTNAEVFPQPFIIDTRMPDPAARTPVSILIGTDRLPVNTSLAIHSLSMNEITTLEGPVEARGGGYYLRWDGLDAAGKPVPSGIYLYSIDTDGQERTGKIVVIRK